MNFHRWLRQLFTSRPAPDSTFGSSFTGAARRPTLWAKPGARALEQRRVLNASVQILSAPAVSAEGSELTLFADGNGAEPLRFEWTAQHDGTDIASSDEQSFYPVGPDDGILNVTVRMTDSAGNVATDTRSIEILNRPPELFVTRAEIQGDGQTLRLEGTLIDPGVDEQFDLSIDWNDPAASALQQITLPLGVSTFSIDHTYANPVGGSPFPIELLASDGTDSVSLSVNISSAPVPEIVGLSLPSQIDEARTATLRVELASPTAGTNQLRIDWGDSDAVEIIALSPGQRIFDIEHRFLDDIPSGTSLDPITVEVAITDPQGRSDLAAIDTTIRNRPPESLRLQASGSVDVGDELTLNVAYGDAGPLDSHVITVDWGDGLSPSRALNLGAKELLLTHRYTTDNGGNPFTIVVSVEDDDGGLVSSSKEVQAINTAPGNIQFLPINVIEEGLETSLTFSFTDANLLDTHTIAIDWGDGTPLSPMVVPVGTREFTATHRYEDDDPSGTQQDAIPIEVRISDLSGATSTASTTVTVKNVAPEILFVDPVFPIDEGQTAGLNFEFDDQGRFDTHQVTLDWGDGTVEMFDLNFGTYQRYFEHTYLDDNGDLPFTIDITIMDDDGATISTSTEVVVSDVPLSDLVLEPVTMIEEDEFASLTFSFTDPGILDQHTVTIDWGDTTDPQVIAIPVGQREFTATHQYTDDNPSGTGQDDYTIVVALQDEVGTVLSDETTVTVKNITPVILFVDPVFPIDEGQTAGLNFEFDDQGRFDTHQVTLDWGDGTVEMFDLNFGTYQRYFEHTYLDDNGDLPFTIDITIMDDDGATISTSTEVVVSDVPVSDLVLQPVSMIEEDEFASLTFSFTDPGILDQHTVTIDWGDTTDPQVIAIPVGQREFTATHQYTDDNPSGTGQDDYTIVVALQDEVGTVLSDETTVTVKNITPVILFVDPVFPIDEGQTAGLNFEFDDQGRFDTHQVTLDWGDGTVEMFDLNFGTYQRYFEHTYLDDNGDLPFTIDITIMDDDGATISTSTEVVVSDVPVSDLVLQPVSMIEEDEFASLTFSFTDPGILDQHTVTIDWGDTTDPQVIAIPVGQREITATHQYTDDNPSGTGQDDYTIVVALQDEVGTVLSDETTVTVKNITPVILFVDPVFPINEGQTAGLNFEFDDQGRFDTHQVTLDWGDGTVEMFDLNFGTYQRYFEHTYLDDNGDLLSPSTSPSWTTMVRRSPLPQKLSSAMSPCRISC